MISFSMSITAVNMEIEFCTEKLLICKIFKYVAHLLCSDVLPFMSF